jgi:phospholipid/cholesterol/gamma-HCH transport system substrate-binding protein
MTRIQLALFTVVALGTFAVLGLGYLNAPATWFGIGRYQVVVELPEAAGLYKTGNVLYRRHHGRPGDGCAASPTPVSRRPVAAIGHRDPLRLDAEVHSATAIGEHTSP